MSNDLIITTTDYIPGYRVKKVLGLVSGSVVKARNIGRDLMGFPEVNTCN